MVRLHKIGNQEGDRPAFRHAVQKMQRLGDVGPDAFGLEVEHFADYAQDVPPPFFGRDVQLDLVGKDDQADFVVVLERREREDRREFRGDLVREIRRHKPDVVMTTDPHRRGFYQHRDHRITGQVTMDAVFPLARDHLSFPEHKELGLEPHKTGYVYLWGSDNADTHIDIGDTLSTKIEALKRHESQIAPRRNVDFEKFMRENAERAGKENGLKVAESFRVIEMRR